MTDLEPHIIQQFETSIEGDFLTSQPDRLMYSTDASAYREIPYAVAIPRNKEDIRKLVFLAGKNNIPLIPRTAGTSLAGQVVGKGIIVDVSRHFGKILHIDVEKKEVTVEPGVILDELNMFLKPYGLFFGPETSTASRCMVAGMVGNNACGLHSLIYGSTREHTKRIKAYLSDGSEVTFGSLTNEEFKKKTLGGTLENNIYKQIDSLLSDTTLAAEIRKEFPDPEVVRRNTGYALDLLLETAPFTDTEEPFNFCKLLAGSEGTLAFFTEITLNLVPLPPQEKAILCVHLNSLDEAMQANLIALQHKPQAIELMDKSILDLAAKNKLQKENRFFIQGDPAAILIVEFADYKADNLANYAHNLKTELRAAGYGYHFPLITGADINKVWALRKAGLGVLSNAPGDARPVSVTEDTAVHPRHLPEYIKEFTALMEKYGKPCTYHAHIATGELHLRPMLNLKDPNDVKLFHDIALDSANLVKKYRGSLSGEHGDGRLRGEFIPIMVGENIYSKFCDLKQLWDPKQIFNPGKITHTPAMNTSLRYTPGKKVREIKTYFDFSKTQGILRASEKCNGSGDCRKTENSGGTMCPSYMASRDEKNVTRARANILREFLTNSPKENPFDHKEIYEVMDMCLSCKACKSECPSNVDVAKLKAEFLQHYYDAHHVPLRTWMISYLNSFYKLGMIWPGAMNFFMTNPFLSKIIKSTLGFSTKRSMPALTKKTLNSWMKGYAKRNNETTKNGIVYLFADEFTNYLDTEIGTLTIRLLNKLGYQVIIPAHGLSARTFLSKGMLRKAKKIITQNILQLKDLVSEETPLIGIEPSAILGFRDEYPELVDAELQQAAEEIGKNALLFEEFFMREVKKHRITKEQFTDAKAFILLHGHCQQKAVASTMPLRAMLSFPTNYGVKEIPSGCCGMAGSFGYEKEHYDLSMKVGELVLLPAVREAAEDTLIVAPGTSCRHQIKDGTGRIALHPVEVMWQALNGNAIVLGGLQKTRGSDVAGTKPFPVIMKIKTLVFIILLLFSSCTPYYINAIKNLEKTPFEPILLTPTTEVNGLRIDIIRNTYIKTVNDSVQQTEDEDYFPLGFYLGNGLFYDLNENLSLRVDSLLGVAKNFTIEMTSHPEKNKGIVVYAFEDDSLIKTYPPRKKTYYKYHREVRADSVSYKYKNRLRYSIVKNDTALLYGGKRKFYRGIYTLDDGLYCLNYKRKRELYQLEKNQVTLEKDYIIRMLNNNTTIQIQRKGRKKGSTLYTIEKNDHEIYIYSNRYHAKKIVRNEDNILIYNGKVLWRRYSYKK